MENLFDLVSTYDNIRMIIDIALKDKEVLYRVSEDAPNTFKSMKRHYETHGYFLIYNGGDHGFIGKEYNIKFRALHDYMHLNNNLSFKFEDEKKLSDITCEYFVDIAKEYLNLNETELSNIKTVINAEIKGQIEYYEKYNKFVSDQKIFIRDYIFKKAV